MTKDTDFPDKRRANRTARIAYGYKPASDDPCILIPDEDMVDFIVEALDHIDNGGSLRETAAWLTQKTGKSISHQGINKIWKERRGALDGNKREKQQKRERKARAPKTGPEKAKAKIKRKASDAKRVLTLQKKKLEQWKEDTPKVTAPKPVRSVSDTLDFEAAPPEKEIIFQPNPGPQTEFLSAIEREVLYGGAAGGGKTYSLIADPMRYFSHPEFNGLILRRTNDELREIIFKTQLIYPKAFKGAKWQEKKSQWVFPSGARLWLTYLERDEDCLRYQGQAFSYIAFDELTQYPTPFAWNFLRSRLRTTADDLPIYMRATSNPGGPGHGWVKKAWIDPAPATQAFNATDLDTGEELRYPDSHPDKAGQPLFQRRFIPASLYDNPYLASDGAYEANLLSLPEMQRRQLLDGDWAVASGAAFTEFRTKTHVVEPFEIPDNWRKFRSADYGYSSFSAVHWYAIDPAYNTLIVYRELYLSKHTGRDLAKAVIAAENGEKLSYGVLDSSCWHQRGQLGPSIAEEMISQGCRWRPSDRSRGSRVAGKNRLHELLKVDEETQLAGIVFFDTCRQIIADLPTIPSDPKGSDDIDPRYASDHAYDSIRYGIQSRPRAFSAFDDGRGIPQQKWQPADNTFGY